MSESFRRRCLQLLPAAIVATAALPATTVPLKIQQGTDISLSATRDGQTLVTGLAGRLWRLPGAGGDAVAITPKGEYARSPALSPDGRTIAYQSLHDGVFQIVLIDLDGGNERRVTSGPWNHISPSWSPDGRGLAMSSDRGGDFGVWELNVESLELRQLTFESGLELDPAWDPSGKTLAYISARDGHGSTSTLLVRQPFQPPQTLVNSDTALRAPSWRPDGSVITFVAEGSQGQGPRLNMVILSDPPVVKPVSRSEEAAAGPVFWLTRDRLLYAADGQIRQREFGTLVANDIPFQATLDLSTVADPPQRILPAPPAGQPVRALGGLALLPNGHVIVSALGDLWELDAGGALVRALTQDPFVDRDPATDDEGRLLAFVSDRDGTGQVWTLDLVNGKTEQITAESDGAARPAWSPRADQLAYLAGVDGGGAAALKIISLNTGEVAELASGLTDVGTPAWSPEAANVAVIQREPRAAPTGARLLLLPASVDGTRRRVTLPDDVVGPGLNHAQWSPDGKAMLIASSAGIRVLPLLDNGRVGADFKSITGNAADIARWAPEAGTVWFTNATGLFRAASGAEPERVPVPLTWNSAPATGQLVIRAGRVFDGKSAEYLLNQDIVIEGNRIVELRPWSAEAPDEPVLDARNRTVVPGLIDLSLHLPATAGERLGRTFLAYGSTTVQALASPGTDLAGIAERWQRHGAGPRLVEIREVCGPPQVPAPDAYPPRASVRLCPAAMDRLSSLGLTAHSSGLTVWSPSWLAALSGAVDVIGPIGSASPGFAYPGMMGSGRIYQDAIDTLAYSGVTVVPQLALQGLPLLVEEQPDLITSAQYLSLFRETERQAQAAIWRAAVESDRVALRNGLRNRQQALGRIMAVGGRLAVASGSPGTPYGLGLHAELRLLARAGFRPFQVLRMATADAARALGLQAEIGSVAPGHRADLLIVNGDPLQNLADLQNVDTVITDGRPLPLSQLLPQQPAALKKFTPPQEARSQKQPRRRESRSP